MKIIIIGVGSFAGEILALFPGFGLKKDECLGFLDDNKTGGNVLGSIKDHKVQPDVSYICSIADPDIKDAISQKFLSEGASFINLIHNTCIIAETASLGIGNILFPNVYVANSAKIENFCTINFNASIGHEVYLGSSSTVCSHCDITGRVSVGERVFMGSHATVAPGCKIGNGAKIGIGSAVIRSVKPGSIVMGVPARLIKE